MDRSDLINRLDKAIDLQGYDVDGREAYIAIGEAIEALQQNPVMPDFAKAVRGYKFQGGNLNGQDIIRVSERDAIIEKIAKDVERLQSECLVADGPIVWCVVDNEGWITSNQYPTKEEAEHRCFIMNAHGMPGNSYTVEPYQPVKEPTNG